MPVSNLKAWLTSAGQKILGVFILTFLGTIEAAGANIVHVSTLKAAAIAGLGAATTTLEALVGNVINPTSTSIVQAIKARRVQSRLILPTP